MIKKILILGAFIVLLPLSAGAETMYLTDHLEVAVRAGKGLEFKILAIVKSNEKVEALTIDGEYANIKLANEIEGWILRRYLTQEMPKPLVIEGLESQIEKIQGKYNRAKEDIRTYKEAKAELLQIKRQQARKIETLEKDFEELKSLSSDAIKLKEDNEGLKQEMIANRREVSKLRRENEELRKNTNLMWFVVGASAVLIGFIIGLILQGLRLKRRKQLSF